MKFLKDILKGKLKRKKVKDNDTVTEMETDTEQKSRKSSSYSDDRISKEHVEGKKSSDSKKKKSEKKEKKSKEKKSKSKQRLEDKSSSGSVDTKSINSSKTSVISTLTNEQKVRLKRLELQLVNVWYMIQKDKFESFCRDVDELDSYLDSLLQNSNRASVASSPSVALTPKTREKDIKAGHAINELPQKTDNLKKNAVDSAAKEQLKPIRRSKSWQTFNRMKNRAQKALSLNPFIEPFQGNFYRSLITDNLNKSRTLSIISDSLPSVGYGNDKSISNSRSSDDNANMSHSGSDNSLKEAENLQNWDIEQEEIEDPFDPPAKWNFSSTENTNQIENPYYNQSVYQVAHCMLCKKAIVDPVETCCGHDFCAPCLQDYWIFDNIRNFWEMLKCPKCKQNVEQIEFRSASKMEYYLLNVYNLRIREKLEFNTKQSMKLDLTRKSHNESTYSQRCGKCDKYTKYHVLLICGHEYCGDCLLSAWEGSKLAKSFPYSCTICAKTAQTIETCFTDKEIKTETGANLSCFFMNYKKTVILLEKSLRRDALARREFGNRKLCSSPTLKKSVSTYNASSSVNNQSVFPVDYLPARPPRNFCDLRAGNHYAVGTSCKHMFCAKCFLIYWENSKSKLICPTCFQEPEYMLQLFSNDEADTGDQEIFDIMSKIASFNNKAIKKNQTIGSILENFSSIRDLHRKKENMRLNLFANKVIDADEICALCYMPMRFKMKQNCGDFICGYCAIKFCSSNLENVKCLFCKNKITGIIRVNSEFTKEELHLVDLFETMEKLDNLERQTFVTSF